MVGVILTSISSFISGIFILFWGYLLYDIKQIKLRWHIIPVFLIYSFVFTYSAYYFSALLHIGIIILSTLILHQVCFRKSFSEICSVVFSINVIRLITILIYTTSIKYIEFLWNNNYYWFGVLTVHLSTTLIILLVRKRLINKIKNYDIYKDHSWKSVIILNLIIIIIFILEISFFEDNCRLDIIVPIVCILYLFIQIYKFVYQKVTLDCYLTNYYEISKFSKFMEDIIDTYKIKLYDTRDQLYLLKEKIPIKNTELDLYIDTLIEEKSHIDYSWLASLCYFNIPGIKGFLSYKIQEIQNLGVEIELFISDTLIEKYFNLTDEDLKDLYVIIGVFCDNAKEAAVYSVQKIVTIQAYYENNELHFLIANTYTKTVSLSFIDDIGVTNKKEKCGIGLYLVNTILTRNNRLSKKTTIMNDFFIQELIITDVKNI